MNNSIKVRMYLMSKEFMELETVIAETPYIEHPSEKEEILNA